MTFALRTPGPRDAPEIAEVHIATWREAYSHLLPEGYFDEAHVRARHEMWTRLLASPRDDRPVRIAERDGRIIGLAVAGPSIATAGEDPPRDRQLYMLYVLAAEYGSGAGQALLDAVLADAPAQLWVAKDNPRAIAFYRRNGFEFDGVEQHDPLAPKIVDVRMLR